MNTIYETSLNSNSEQGVTSEHRGIDSWEDYTIVILLLWYICNQQQRKTADISEEVEDAAGEKDVS